MYIGFFPVQEYLPASKARNKIFNFFKNIFLIFPVDLILRGFRISASRPGRGKGENWGEISCKLILLSWQRYKYYHLGKGTNTSSNIISIVCAIIYDTKENVLLFCSYLFLFIWIRFKKLLSVQEYSCHACCEKKCRRGA